MRNFLTVAGAGLLAAALLAAPSSGRIAEQAGAGDRAAAANAPLPNFQAKGANLIRLLAGAFDPLRDAHPAAPGIARRDGTTLPSGQPQYWLVQVRDGRFDDASKAIGAAGGKVVGVVPDATYMVRATPAQRAHFAQSSAVRWAGYYQPAWRLPAAHGGRKALLELDGPQTYRVYAFRDDPAAVGRALAGLPGVTVLDDAGSVVDVRATAAQLPAIAALPAVEWVDLKPSFDLLNANARWVTDTGVRDLYAATAAGRLTGAGQTAAVADTAINYTNDRNGLAHVGFRDCPDSTGTNCKLADYTQSTAGATPAAIDGTVANGTSHRKMSAFFDIGNSGPNPGDDAAHGSHVAGSVTGDRLENGTPDGHDGMAPGARLVHQNIGTATGGLTIPADLYDVFRQAYRPRNPASVAETSGAGGAADYGNYLPNEDARTHNNSWSSTLVAVPNSALSMVVDRFVWDHEDMTIVFSAANSGPGANTISAPSNAKNDITSGASANGRQPMSSIDSMASFSSHGPTHDGRFGPDVATPGQIIVSTKGGTTDGYHYLQGTSMSGPVLTGLATLVRQYFYDGYATRGGDGVAAGAPSETRRHNPSAALVKATLVNSAVRMRGWYTGTDGRERSLDGEWPSAGQGFGLANLDNGLYFAGDPSNGWYQDVWRGDAAAFPVSAVPAARTYPVRVQAGEPLDVTLSWTDAPNLLPAGSPALVNNLDLTVTGPTGTIYVGNNMNSRLTPSVNSAETLAGPGPADVRNVTERVRIAAPATGTYTITVAAGPIAVGNQGFALAASGRISEPAGLQFTPGPARQADAAGSPAISNLRVEPVTSDTAVVRFTTSEPTTATATAGASTYVDSYNVGNDAPNIGSGGGFVGLNEGQVETSAAYANKPVLTTEHEILLTGVAPGTASVAVTATDVAGNQTGAATPAATAPGVFGADAPDIGQLVSGTAGGWRTGTQLYAGTSGTTIALGAFMFRVPQTVDPAEITGAAIEMTSGHDLVARYTQDPVLYVDLLSSDVEGTWGSQTYEQIHAAPAAARVYPETTHKRGGGSTYAFTFNCGDLQALKDTLAPATAGQRLAAFRWDSTAPGLFSMEPGFNRRSQGPDKRPRLVLFTADDPNPYGRPCDPSTPAPAISGVGIHEGSAAGSMTVSWETDVQSDSMVLFRKKSETGWTQVGTPALTRIHHVQLRGLDLSQDYVFVVRSAACNGEATTDTNGGQGYAFFKTVTVGPRTVDAVFDFEEGAAGWTAETTTTQDPNVAPDTTWELKPPGHESATGWYAEPYGDLDQARLTSPPITLSGSLGAVEFFARHDFEVQPTPLFTTSDGLYVEYSPDGGTTWNTIATYKGQSPNYPAFQPKQTDSFPVPPGGALVRFKVLSDDNVSFPPFQGAALDRVTFVSYTTTGETSSDQRPLSGPATPPSAGEAGLTAPAIRTGPASAADVAAGTGTCSIAGPATQPDLVVRSIVASNTKSVREGQKVTVTATVANEGDAAAPPSATQFLLDGTTVLGLVDTPAIAAGGSATVSVQWDTRDVKGEHTIRVTADQPGALAESNEGNNAATLTVTVKGNKVQNGSFEQASSDGSGPAAWTGESTGAGTASWSEGGSDGSKSASVSGGGGNAALVGSPSWTSAPVTVTPGETLDLVVSVNASGVSSAPTAGLALVGAAGQVLDTVKLISAPTLTLGFQTLEQAVTIPAGVAQARVVLSGFAATDLATAGTVTFDEVGLYAR